jgi:hypothetical protein
MDVTGRPWGIANIDDTRVVVTFPYIGSGYLEILDISNNKLEKAINNSTFLCPLGRGSVKCASTRLYSTFVHRLLPYERRH